MMNKKVPLTEDPAFRDLNWDLPLSSEIEDKEWSDDEE